MTSEIATPNVAQLSTAKLRAKLDARRAKEVAEKAAAQAAANVSRLPFQADIEGLKEAVESSLPATKTDYMNAVDAAVSTITIREAYDKFSKGIYRKGDKEKSLSARNVQVSCPFPAHADANPTSGLAVSKLHRNGEYRGGVGNCFQCGEFDKFDIAALHYGLHPQRDFNEICERMAADLRSVHKPQPVSQPVVPRNVSAAISKRHHAYLQKVISNQVDLLRRRTDPATMYNAGFELGRLSAGNGWPVKDAVLELVNTASAVGFDANQALTSICHGVVAGTASPRIVT
jgi:hypothetical protein